VTLRAGARSCEHGSMSSSARATEAQLLEQLRSLYAEADALYAGFECPRSTECCRFGITGREPYVTSLERVAIERALARRGGPLRSSARALPLAGSVGSERACPLLDRGGRCAVYADRPLGCRTFYCARASGDPAPERRELRALVQRVRELAGGHTPGGDRARPLTRALACD
jgi:Fe-S-cluster containining protein